MATDKQQAATPRTDTLHKEVGVSWSWLELCRDLEGTLTERTEQLAEAREVADSNWKQCVAAAEVEASARKAIQRLADCLALKAPADVVVTAAIDNLTRIIDEKRTAEAEVARLKDLVGRCRAVIAYDSPSAPILTEIDKEINP